MTDYLSKVKALDEKRKQEVLAFLTTGYTLNKALQQAGVSEAEHNNWKHKDIEYQREFFKSYRSRNDKLIEKAYQAVEGTLHSADEKVCLETAKFILKNLGKSSGFNEENNSNKNVINLNVSKEQGMRIASAYLSEEQYIQGEIEGEIEQED